MDIYAIQHELHEHRRYVMNRIESLDSYEQVVELIEEVRSEYQDKTKGHEKDYQAAKILEDMNEIGSVSLVLDNQEESKDLHMNNAILHFATISKDVDALLNDFKHGLQDDISDFIDMIDYVLETSDFELIQKRFNAIIRLKETYDLTKITYTLKKGTKIKGYKKIDDLLKSIEKKRVFLSNEAIDLSGYYYRRWAKLLEEFRLSKEEASWYKTSIIKSYNTNSILDALKQYHIAKQTYYNFFPKFESDKDKEKSHIEFERKFFINLALYLCMSPEQTERFLRVNGFTLEESKNPADRLLFSLIELDLDLYSIDKVMTKLKYKGLTMRDLKRKTSLDLIGEYRVMKSRNQLSSLTLKELFRYQKAYQQELNIIDRFLEPKLVLIDNAPDKKSKKELSTFTDAAYKSNVVKPIEVTIEDLEDERRWLIEDLQEFDYHYANFDDEKRYEKEEKEYFDKSFKNIIKRSSKAIIDYDNVKNKLKANVSKSQSKYDAESDEKKKELLKEKLEEKTSKLEAHISKKYYKKFYDLKSTDDEMINYNELDTLYKQLTKLQTQI